MIRVYVPQNPPSLPPGLWIIYQINPGYSGSGSSGYIASWCFGISCFTKYQGHYSEQCCSMATLLGNFFPFLVQYEGERSAS